MNQLIRCLTFGLCLFAASLSVADDPIKVLILDGRNNHDWAITSKALHQTLKQSGRFEVTFATAPATFNQQNPRPRRPGKKAPKEAHKEFESTLKQWQADEQAYNKNLQVQWSAWRPKFSDFDVVLNNYNGQHWSDAMRSDFVDFVQKGGGVVNIHAANNPFSDWPEFNQMIGLGWRNPNQGTRVVINDEDGKQIKSEPGQGPGAGHGRRHPFVVKTRHTSHPIMKGIPVEWFHGIDELYHGQRGPAANLDILASAFSDPKTGGTGKHEPMIWTTKFGEGRVVTNLLGHLWPGEKHKPLQPYHCVGFQTVLIRSLEWAATGRTQLDVPDSFPEENELSIVEPAKMKWTFEGKALGSTR